MSQEKIKPTRPRETIARFNFNDSADEEIDRETLALITAGAGGFVTLESSEEENLAGSGSTSSSSPKVQE